MSIIREIVWNTTTYGKATGHLLPFTIGVGVRCSAVQSHLQRRDCSGTGHLGDFDRSCSVASRILLFRAPFHFHHQFPNHQATTTPELFRIPQLLFSSKILSRPVRRIACVASKRTQSVISSVGSGQQIGVIRSQRLHASHQSALHAMRYSISRPFPFSALTAARRRMTTPDRNGSSPSMPRIFAHYLPK